jgi:Tol biopolymer transport system component/C-terminal processing protease CtpA/Prc
MKKISGVLSTILFLTLNSITAHGQIKAEWMRYVSISPDAQSIAFTYKGDIYTVPVSGGEAKRLTFHKAHDYMPVWSNDGSRLAFASDRYGNFDIYVMSALGGEARRLTFHSGDEEPYTFTNDDSKILFKAQRQDSHMHRQHPTGRQAELYSVSATGGRVKQVFTIPAEYTQISPDGKIMVFQDNKGFEDPLRKHHRSSIARDIWTYNTDTGVYKMITVFEGEDRNPVFAEGSNDDIYYLSEESGSFNVHKRSLTLEGNVQLTNFDLHPVRFLSQAKGTLAFGYHGLIYTMTEETDPVEVEVTIRTQDIDNSDEVLSVNGEVQEMAVSPNGKEIAFISRGEVFVTSKEGSLTKRITNTPEPETDIQFSSDGKTLIYASEREGKWSIYQTSRLREEEPFFYGATLIQEKSLIENEKDNYLPKLSPDGKKIAWIEDRRTLKVSNLDGSDEVTLLGPDMLFHMSDGDKYFTWSPDSKWLLFEYDKLLNNSDILLLDVSGKTPMKHIMQSGYNDYRPMWANEGKQMIWFSNRNGLRSYATSGRSELDVYAMFFTQEAWDKFNMSKDDFELMQEIEKANKEKSEDEDEDDKEKKTEDDDPKELTFDWKGMEDRVARLTIHSSSLAGAVLSKDAEKLIYLARFEGGYDIWTTDLRTRETKMALKLNARSASLMWDKEMENLYLLSSGSISVLGSDLSSKKPVQISSEMTTDREAERAYAFDHVWLRTSKIFYEPTFHGIDWNQMKDEYEPKVKHLGNEYEFAELLSEMLGELNVSHAGGRYSGGIPNQVETASLGIFMDFSHEGDGIKIAEVIEGGPLDKASLEIEPGMIIHKIDGEVVSEDRDVAEYLNRKADTFVLIEVTDSKGKNAREYTVKPISLSEESGLLYERFVKKNEEEVKRLSNGRLGYVHIPGMGDGPYRNIFNDMMGKYLDMEAVVVDARFNGGGDLVADLAMFFTGEPFLSYETEDMVVGGEPTSRWTKPVVTIFNESMYSDGHCYASGFQDLDLGISVGMPVPGTCSFAGWEGLPNGVVWGVVPVSAKNKAGEWLENNQTDPDVIVRNQPALIINGRDEQLEKAVELMLEDLDQEME